MSWARFDDRFHGNRKVRLAWRQSRAAIGLYVMSVTYCAQHETDGHVDHGFVEEQLPQVRERNAAVKALVDAGLWLVGDEGWLVHDYLDYHNSAEQAAAAREKQHTAKSRAGKAGAAARWSKPPPSAANGSAMAPAIADTSQVPMAEMAPDPTRPDTPIHQSQERGRSGNNAASAGSSVTPSDLAPSPEHDDLGGQAA